MPFTIATPSVLTDPGALFWAPLGTALPGSGAGGVVAGGVFTDSWSAPWVPLGATIDGSEFSYDIKVAEVAVAEFFDPIRWATTGRSGMITFAMADFTMTKLSYAMNGGTLTIVSGTGATQLNKFSPPAPGLEVRAMIGWESLDHTVRIVCYQALNSGSVKLTFKKVPSLTGIACQFQLEKPTSTQPFEIYAASSGRA